VPYDVILEPKVGEPVLLVTTTSELRAREEAERVMLAHGPASGVKVHVRVADSGDQLQVTRSGQALRDQPHLNAVGEALTIHVPTVKVRIHADE
jgi:hypothetical protein